MPIDPTHARALGPTLAALAFTLALGAPCALAAQADGERGGGARSARLRLVSEPPGLELHVWSDAEGQPSLAPGSSFMRHCAAPCETSLPEGRHRLGVSELGASPVSLPRSLLIDGDATAQLSLLSRAGERTAGFVVIGAGVALGAGLAIGSALVALENDQTTAIALSIGALVTFLLAEIVGLSLAVWGDTAEVRLRAYER